MLERLGLARDFLRSISRGMVSQYATEYPTLTEWGVGYTYAHPMMAGLQDFGFTDNPTGCIFTWAEWCDLLDDGNGMGVDGKPAVPLRLGDGKIMPSLDRRLTSPGQYFFEANPAKRAIEIFGLKLSLLEAVSNAAAEGHERHFRAFGIIEPEIVLVDGPGQSGSGVPVRWRVSATVRPVSPEIPNRLGTMPEEMAKGLVLLPPDADLTFAAPLVKQWPLGRELCVTALVQSADVIPDDDVTEVRGLVRVHIIADELVAREFSDQDVFRVTFSAGTDRDGEIALWARKVDSPERGLVVSGLTDAMPSDRWNVFAQTTEQVRSTAKANVYRSCSPKTDVYSCGMLLLRALLGMDAGRWYRVCEALSVVLESIEPLVQGVDREDDFTIHARGRDRLREWGDLFEQSSIPQELWWDGLLTALRACSQLEGFGYGLTGSGRSPLRDLAHDVGCLGRRVRQELFEAHERDTMIARVCDRVLADVG